MIGKLHEVIDNTDPFVHVDNAENDEVLGKEIFLTSDYTEQDLIRGGNIAALDWVADMLVDRIERNAEHYQRGYAAGPSDADLKYGAYEMQRVLSQIDEERAKEAIDTLREAEL